MNNKGPENIDNNESESKKSKLGPFEIVLLGTLLGYIGFIALQKEKVENILNSFNDIQSISSGISENTNNIALYRETIISYLSQPEFSTDKLLKIITHTDAKLELYDIQEEMLYFSYPKEGFNQKVLGNLSLSPENIDYGVNKGSEIDFGTYFFRSDNENIYFRFPKDDFRIYGNEKITINFGKGIKYLLTLPELQKYFDNDNSYNGKLKIIIGEDEELGYKIMGNHGAFVAKPGESSLMRLSQNIIGKGGTQEQNIQSILNFVTNYIKYNNVEANLQGEMLKQPHEVLMSGKSDCSGKTILLASLFEQINADFFLVYYKKHISIAVEGNFPLNNGYNFNYRGKTYYIAESTAPGFIIGETKTTKDLGLANIRYIQKLGDHGYIKNAHTGKKAKFLD